MKKQGTGTARTAFNLMVLLLVGFGMFAAAGAAPHFLVTPALADDDGDDGGGSYGGGGRGDDDDDGYRGGGQPPRVLRQLMRPFGGVFRPARPRRSAPVVRIPAMAEREIVAMGLSDDNLTTLQGRGYEIVEQATLPALDRTVVKLEIPEATDLDAARQEIRTLDTGADVDFNHYYSPSQGVADRCEGQGCWPRELIGWPADGPADSGGCRAPVRIGMIDTGINPDHEAFDGTVLEVKRIGDEEERESGRQHGTAVAALLAGALSSRTSGLLPEARLFAVDAFFGAGGGNDRAEAFHLVAAIDYLIGRQVSVINMSLAGEANEVLRQAIGLATADGRTVLVAAVGNEGPRAGPVYPAAYPGVLAVTAVDRSKRVYRRAVQGAYVDIAAPGVGIWTAASIRGGRPKTGTSFAAPYVAAAAALLKAREPDLKWQEVKERLYARASDIGEPGRDDVFGWGLLNASEICNGSAKPASAPADQLLPSTPQVRDRQ